MSQHVKNARRQNVHEKSGLFPQQYSTLVMNISSYERKTDVSCSLTHLRYNCFALAWRNTCKPCRTNVPYVICGQCSSRSAGSQIKLQGCMEVWSILAGSVTCPAISIEVQHATLKVRELSAPITTDNKVSST